MSCASETNCAGARRNGDYDQRIDEASGYCVACLAAEAVHMAEESPAGSDLRERAAVLVAQIFTVRGFGKPLRVPSGCNAKISGCV